jgi:hypothetical protein
MGQQHQMEQKYPGLLANLSDFQWQMSKQQACHQMQMLYT